MPRHAETDTKSTNDYPYHRTQEGRGINGDARKIGATASLLYLINSLSKNRWGRALVQESDRVCQCTEVQSSQRQRERQPSRKWTAVVFETAHRFVILCVVPRSVVNVAGGLVFNAAAENETGNNRPPKLLGKRETSASSSSGRVNAIRNKYKVRCFSDSDTHRWKSLRRTRSG